MSSILSPAASSRPGTSRQSHRKTRTGCSGCKLRKVKCDEQKPSCGNCTRRFTTCVYVPVGPRSGSTHGYARGQAHIALGHDANRCGSSSISQTTSPAAGGLELPPIGNPEIHPTLPPVISLNMLDLELLHNFSTSTCYTLSSNQVVRDVGRIEAPKVALCHEFVMRALLAISALHLAHLRPEKRSFYLDHAKAQHDAGMRQAIPLIATLNPENCAPLYLFSMYCCIFATGRPHETGDFVIVGEKGEADWFTIIRGCRAIMESSSNSLLSSPFGPMLQQGIKRGKLRETAILEKDYLLPLRQAITESCTTPELLPIYDTALDELRKCYAVVYSLPPKSIETSDVFSWLFHISDKYIELLRQKTPESLSIFAYYGVLFQVLSGKWWVDGFGRHIISTVYKELDQNHRPWIRWAIEEIGGVPE